METQESLYQEERNGGLEVLTLMEEMSGKLECLSLNFKQDLFTESLPVTELLKDLQILLGFCHSILSNSELFDPLQKPSNLGVIQYLQNYSKITKNGSEIYMEDEDSSDFQQNSSIGSEYVLESGKATIDTLRFESRLNPFEFPNFQKNESEMDYYHNKTRRLFNIQFDSQNVPPSEFRNPKNYSKNQKLEGKLKSDFQSS